MKFLNQGVHEAEFILELQHCRITTTGHQLQRTNFTREPYPPIVNKFFEDLGLISRKSRQLMGPNKYIIF